MRSAGHRLSYLTLLACFLVSGAILLAVPVASDSFRAAAAPLYEPLDGGDLKVTPLGFLTNTFEYVPGQTYVLGDKAPGSPDSTTAFMDFNGRESASVDLAWLACGYNPAVVTDSQWMAWCQNNQYRGVTQAKGPTQYWVGDSQPESGPFYEARLQWGEGLGGWWLVATRSSDDYGVCGDISRFLAASASSDFDIPVLDLPTGSSGRIWAHLRALPRFHIQNSYADCNAMTWHIEGVVAIRPSTETPAPTPSSTLSPSSTATATDTPTLMATSTASPTATGTHTATVVPSLTPTDTPLPPSLTPTGAATWTVVPTQTPALTATAIVSATSMATATETATVCSVTYGDVQPSDYFYQAVSFLACRGAISGYSDGSFRPYNNTTRGQLSKIVVLAEGWALYAPDTATFADVPPASAFYAYVETALQHGIVSGYSCGTGCLLFRPGTDITRGQLTKVVVLAQGWSIIPPAQPTFRDVPPSDPFFGYVETAYQHGVISGYSCGGGCAEFRPGNSATRGQIAKIVYNAVTLP